MAFLQKQKVWLEIDAQLEHTKSLSAELGRLKNQLEEEQKWDKIGDYLERWW